MRNLQISGKINREIGVRYEIGSYFQKHHPLMKLYKDRRLNEKVSLTIYVDVHIHIHRVKHKI